MNPGFHLNLAADLSNDWGPPLITTRYGSRQLRIPRGRVVVQDGSTEEFQSHLVERYQRRTLEVDEAILGCYLAGANSRRIKKALTRNLSTTLRQLAELISESGQPPWCADVWVG